MKIFLIAPHRNATEWYLSAVAAQVEALESQGHKVHWPTRDTVQTATGIDICQQNRQAIKDADVVYVVWDGRSRGCLFDLGMAFAMGKKIVPVVGYVPTRTRKKSFANVIHDWADIYDEGE